MIDAFFGEYRFLSNFWPCVVRLDSVPYLSVEAAYQAAKTDDKQAREILRRCYSASQAKRFGRTVKLRADWDKVKLAVMEDLLRQKFSDTDLRQKLLDTGEEELVEGNTWNDTFWGRCGGVGENHLGRLLLKIRSDLLKEK